MESFIDTMNKSFLEHLLQDKIVECEWLDYKQKWHDNKVELLKDIFAFVNTPHHEDCYLIFGIEDGTFNVIGLEEDTHRRNTQNILDFLNSKELSTEMPRVVVETFQVEGKIVDVLTVKNTTQVPIFLKRSFNDGKKKCTPGQVFTRIGDTNTAIDSSADDFVLEKLYKKRLHLDQSIYDRYRYLIEQLGDWTYIDSEQKLLYNYDPNFYILIVRYELEEETRRIHTGDYYSWLAHESVHSWDWRINEYNNVLFMYGTHKIFEIGALFYFDRYRGITVAPRYGELGNNNLSYMYLLSDSLSMKFMKLLSSAWDRCMGEPFHSAYYSARLVFDNIVLYENDDERDYVESHYDYRSTIEDVEYDCGMTISPTEEQVIELQKKNQEFTKITLIRNNIAKTITKKLKELRSYD